jgi:hypothetical protein
LREDPGGIIATVVEVPGITARALVRPREARLLTRAD